MRKVNESGRSLLEMLAVLAIIAILILASLFLFNNLIQYYQRKDTEKQLNTIVTHYRSTKLVRRRNGVIKLNDILPGAQGNTKTQNNKEKLELIDKEGTNTFVVIATLKELTCRDVIVAGNYDAVSKGYDEKFYSPDEAKETKILEAICSEGPVYLFYGKNRKATGKHWVDGDLSDCPAGEVMDASGSCCAQLVCGSCSGCKAPTPHCNGTTCVQCTEDIHCPENTPYCVDNQCVACKEVGKKCPGETSTKYCNDQHECEECKECQTWNGYACVDKPKYGLGTVCTDQCDCESGYCENGRCKTSGACTTDERTCQDASGSCVCCEPKTQWDEVHQKCECPLGFDYDDDTKKCVKGANLTCPSIFEKGASCAGYGAYENDCCEKGLSCRDNTCQCQFSNQYQGECNTACGCASAEFVCQNNQCVCTDNRDWNSEEQKCCPADTPYYSDSMKQCVKVKCDADMDYVSESESCVCKADSPQLGQACSTTNECCAKGLECKNKVCSCASTSPIGHDPQTCLCPEGTLPEKVFSGATKCFPICKTGQEKADLVFMLDNSGSLKHKFNGTTILSQIQKAITTTEIPDTVQYAAYTTATPNVFRGITFEKHNGRTTIYNAVTNYLTGESGTTTFNKAFYAIAKDICPSKPKILVLMYTDGKIDGADFDTDKKTGKLKKSSWKTVKEACADGSEMYVMTIAAYDKTKGWNPDKQFELGETKKMNAAIADYFEKNYCVESSGK